MSRVRVLILTNNLTHGAVPHQILDISECVEDDIELDIGVLRSRGTNRVNPEIENDLRENGSDILKFEFDSSSFLSASSDFIHRTSKFDVLHTNLVRSGVYGRVLSGLPNDVSIISTEHTIHGEYNLKQYLSNTATLPLADYVVCVSNQVRESISSGVKFLLGNERIKTIYNCVDPTIVDQYNNRPIEKRYQSFINKHGYIVGTIGRLVPEKNHKTLLGSMKYVVDEDPSAGLVVIGDGYLRRDLERLANSLGISDRVLFTGHIDRSEVYTLLHKFDTFVMPSQYEGMGIAVVEAMIAKKPIIASDIPVFHEILDGTAWYVEPYNHKGWARNILRLSRESDDSNRRGEKAKERAKRLFSPNSIAKQYSRLYRNSVE